MTETDATAYKPHAHARKAVLTTLSSDLSYEGWDLPSKFWVMLGDNDDPYLEFVGNFEMDPEHWFMHRAQEGVVKDCVIGLVTCWESWTYPAKLNEHFTRHCESGALAIDAYTDIVTPYEHPDRQNVRAIQAVCRDGEVLRVEHYDTGLTEHNAMDGQPLTGATGEPLTDLMRAVLGIHKFQQNPIEWIDGLPGLEELTEKAAREGWSQDRMGAELFRQAPEDLKALLKPSMPENVRKLLDEDQGDD